MYIYYAFAIFPESAKTEKVSTTTDPVITTDRVPVKPDIEPGCHSNNSSSSSSDGAPPEEFQVAMDTNENNLWTKDVMDEKLGKMIHTGV